MQRYSIRRATAYDLRRLTQLTLEAQSKSYYAHLMVADADEIERSLWEMVQHEYVVVVTHGGVVEGFFAGGMTDIWWTRQRGATDLLLYLRPAVKGAAFWLYRRFCRWALTRGASVVSLCFSYSAGPVSDNLHRLLLLAGFEQVGSVYVMDLAPSRKAVAISASPGDAMLNAELPATTESYDKVSLAVKSALAIAMNGDRPFSHKAG